LLDISNSAWTAYTFDVVGTVDFLGFSGTSVQFDDVGRAFGFLRKPIDLSRPRTGGKDWHSGGGRSR
jgi:hypothetical protein